MKANKTIFSLTAITSFLLLLLAFKNVGQGSIYCSKNPTTGKCQEKIDFRITAFSSITDPCDNGRGKEYIIHPNNPDSCLELPVPTYFEQTPQ